jgi:galactokinase
VSCKELDYLVDSVRNNPAVIGARMMGGGFGGCTINIIAKDSVEEIVTNLSAAYHKEMGKVLKYYLVNIEDGTSVIN